MENELTIWFFLDVAAAVLAVFMAVMVLLYRPPAPLWPSLFYILIGAIIWAVGEISAQFFATDPVVHWFWVMVFYTGAIILVPSWFIFTLGYARHIQVKLVFDTKLLRTLPPVIAIGLWCLLVTNPWHHAFITTHITGRNEFHLFWYLQASIHYLYILASIGIFIFLWLKTSAKSVRRQIGIMLLGCSMPLILNSLYVLKLYPLEYDLTVAAFSVTATMFFFAVYKTRLFSLSPYTLQNLLANEVDPYLILNRSGHIMAYSKKADELFPGVRLNVEPNGIDILASRLEVASDNPLDSTPVVPSDFNRCLVEPMLSMTVRTIDAPHIWFKMTSNIVVTAGGKQRGVNIRLREITDLVENHQTIIRQAAMLEGVLSGTEQGVFVLDDSLNVVYINDRFRVIFNVPDDIASMGDEERLFKHIHNHIESQFEKLDQLVASVQELLFNGAIEPNRIIKTKSGMYLERYSGPFQITEKAFGRIWVFQDVTQRVLNGMQRKEIESRVKETERLESLGVMASGIAHDFNNILTAILGRASLILLREGVDDETENDVKLINKAGLQAAELTAQILSYAGRGALSLMSLDLRDFIVQTVEVVQHSTGSNIHFDIHPGISPVISGDAGQLRQVVMNILINGAEAIGKEIGTVDIEVTIETVTSGVDGRYVNDEKLLPGKYGVFRIADTGSGISQLNVQRMFDPFYTTKITGRGLGLASALGIIKDHNGALSVDTVIDEGSRFSVYLPLLS